MEGEKGYEASGCKYSGRPGWEVTLFRDQQSASPCGAGQEHSRRLPKELWLVTDCPGWPLLSALRTWPIGIQRLLGIQPGLVFSWQVGSLKFGSWGMKGSVAIRAIPAYTVASWGGFEAGGCFGDPSVCLASTLPLLPHGCFCLFISKK